MMDRIQLRQQWLEQTLASLNHCKEVTTMSLPGDASFRNYYRIKSADRNFMLMDAPPELEDSHSFVAIAKAYRQNNIFTPQIFAENLEHGFLLIEDFGETLLSDALTTENASTLYRQCYQEIPKIQACQEIANWSLPIFVDKLLDAELANFQEWCVLKFAELKLSHQEEHLLASTFNAIKKVCAEQPQVGVHRDYHSRNLMVLANKHIGIIDFQDAVIGPITYDLVSLLRDCYVAWPAEQVEAWLKDYYENFVAQKKYSLEQFQFWFDWQGLQRHLKAMFIFCRKYLRDGSTNYLNDVRRTLKYVDQITTAYPALHDFRDFIIERWQEPVLARITNIIGPEIK